MPIRAIITDFGSVLVLMTDETPRRQLAERWNVPLERIYKLVFGPVAVQAALGEISVEQHWRAVLDVLGIPPLERAGFIQQFWAADGLNEEYAAYLRSLSGHYKIGLLSNANDDLRQVLTARWQLGDLFDDMVISAEVGLLKPDPRIYQLAAARLNVALDEAVFVDDMPENVAGAQAIGMAAIHYRQFEQARQELEALLQRDGAGRAEA